MNTINRSQNNYGKISQERSKEPTRMNQKFYRVRTMVVNSFNQPFSSVRLCYCRVLFSFMLTLITYYLYPIIRIFFRLVSVQRVHLESGKILRGPPKVLRSIQESQVTMKESVLSETSRDKQK